MHKFTDAKGREWKIALNYGLLQKVKEDLSLDLLDVRNPAGMQKLAFDIEGFVNLLFVVCEDQAKELNVSDVEFGHGLGGDVFDEAFTAFQDEYVDFFPKSQRSILRETLGKMTATTEQAVETALEEIRSPETTAAIQNSMSGLRTSMRGAIATALKASPA